MWLNMRPTFAAHPRFKHSVHLLSIDFFTLHTLFVARSKNLGQEAYSKQWMILVQVPNDELFNSPATFNSISVVIIHLAYITYC